jgi:hypothetical protein
MKCNLFILVCTLAIVFLVWIWRKTKKWSGLRSTILHGRELEGNHAELQEFERRLETWYPLGSEEFRISHGADYSAFFRRLGQPYCVVAYVNKKLIMTCFVVLRECENGQKAWYVGDLKVDPKYRNAGLLAWIYAQHANFFLSKCNAGFGVSMVSTDGSKSDKISRIAHLLGCNTETLCIYLVTGEVFDKLTRTGQLLCRGLVSLCNQKDLILRSSGKPLELWHALTSSSSIDQIKSYPVQRRLDDMVMFCRTTPLLDSDVPVFATARVYATNMKNPVDFLNTSEI